MNEHQVQCDVCKGIFKASPLRINLVCHKCYEERPPDATGKKLISDILKDLEEFELKRYSDMIRTLKKIREKLEDKLKDISS